MLSFRSEHPWGGRSVGQIYHKAWTSIWPPVLTCNGPPAETSDRPLTTRNRTQTTQARPLSSDRTSSLDSGPLRERDDSEGQIVDIHLPIGGIDREHRPRQVQRLPALREQPRENFVERGLAHVAWVSLSRAGSQR